MYDYEVFLLFNDDEVLLGTVGEIIGTGEAEVHSKGMSITAALSDIVSGMVNSSDMVDSLGVGMSETLKIELREKGT